MSDFFTAILLSLSKFIFSSPALTLMANRSSYKALHHTSRSEIQIRNDTSAHHDSQAEEMLPFQFGDDEQKTCLCGDRSEKLNELQSCLRADSSFNTSPPSTQSRVLETPLPREDLDSPTLVPCNSPAFSPSHSLAKVSSVPPSFPDFAHSGKEFSSTAANSVSECLSPETSSFSISLVSDTSEDDEDFHLPTPLDTLFPSAFEVPRRSSLASSSRNLGLGISGLLKKDGTPFDGLGLVSIRASNWRTSTSSPEGLNESASIATTDSTENLSSTLLQEALMTFTEDPFHIHNALISIPECRSWYELDDILRPTSSPVHSEASSEFEVVHHCESHQPQDPASSKYRRISHTHFSSATISSELKRSMSGDSKKTHGVARMRMQTSRPRSVTWPTSNLECFETSRGHGSGGSVNHRASATFSRESGVRRTWRI